MPIRVVVVRPDRAAHTLIAAAFEMSGCEVHCASDAMTAWMLIVHKRPSIILIEYPEQVDGGLDLLHRVEILRERGTIVASALSNALSAEQTRVLASYSDVCYRMPTPPADVVQAILRHAAEGKAPATPPPAIEPERSPGMPPPGSAEPLNR